jgi:hypothetical protein
MTDPKQDGAGASPPAPNWPLDAAPWVGNGWEARWEAAVMEVPWSQRTLGSGYSDWYKYLPCPRCAHQMSVLVGPGAYRDAVGAADHAGRVTASCNCSEAHVGRPERRPGGCGYGAWIPGPAAADQTP